MRRTLEIAVDSLADARAAERAGADRLELCGALELGGVTPTIGLLRRVTHTVAIPVVAMLRVRGGNFNYDNAELETMLADLDALAGECVAGVVFGALDAPGNVDVRCCTAVAERWRAARPTGQLVFHRAFDRVRDPFAALEQVIALGFTRVLTSGQAASAAEPVGVERLARLIERAGNRIEILPGGGIRPENVAALVRATGCTQVHSACRTPGENRIDERAVAQLRATLDAAAG
ncbi:MAG: copper homeostasis protein CutC [Phycisphaerae bacterium]